MIPQQTYKTKSAAVAETAFAGFFFFFFFCLFFVFVVALITMNLFIESVAKDWKQSVVNDKDHGTSKHPRVWLKQNIVGTQKWAQTGTVLLP